MHNIDVFRLTKYKQLSDEVFVISRIIMVEVKGYQLKPKHEVDNPYQDLDYSGITKIESYNCFIIH